MTDRRLLASEQRSAADMRNETCAKAQALWPQIAQELELSPTGVTFHPMKVNSRFVDRRAVLGVQLPEGQRLVLRVDFGETRVARLRHIFDRHRAAANALAQVPGVSAPAILWSHPDQDISVMTFSEGETAFRELDLCALGFGDRAALITRLGRAVAALHRVSAVEERTFWPKQNLAKVSEKAEAVRSGDLDVRRKSKFLGLCAYLHRAGRRARGLTFQAAVEHGDLHARNMLVTDKSVSFIDFSNYNSKVPFNDLANFWLANCPDHLAQAGDIVGFGGLARKDFQAFQRGYGQKLEENPIFHFYFALRLWWLWQVLPVSSAPATMGEQERETGIMSVYDWLVANEPE